MTCVSHRYKKRYGGWVGIVVVVCHKICDKNENCQIETKIGVVIDVDPPIIVVVCGSNFWFKKMGGKKNAKKKVEGSWVCILVKNNNT